MEQKFKILAATDYSEVAVNAQKFAFQLANSTQSDLYLLHIYNIPFSSTPANANDLIQANSDYRSTELSALEHERNALFSEFNVSEKDLRVECMVKSGKAGKQIRNEADDINADFIVIGTHGASKFRETFLGSHTWEVIKKATVPVISVPNYVKFNEIKTIVFGCEYREGEVPVINYLTHLARKLNAKLVLLHISTTKLSKEDENTKLEKFKAEVENEITYHNLEYRIAHYDDIIKGLNDFCLRSKADLLAMSPERSSALKTLFSAASSMTRKMSFHAHVPLLTIPDYYDPDYSKFWNLFKMQTKFTPDDF
jgi:nucleotide-binding universal stress UspA family protein